MIRCRRSYCRAPWTEGVAEVDRVSRGRTTSRNGRASRCHHCPALQRTGVDGQPSQQRHLLGYPNDAWASRFLIDWINTNDELGLVFPKVSTFSKLVEKLLSDEWVRNHDLKTLYAVCCRPEITSNGIASENVKTFKGQDLVNFEVTGSNSI